jgi:[ribosomal protein S5]-alanine N-acetyltransferase
VNFEAVLSFGRAGRPSRRWSRYSRSTPHLTKRAGAAKLAFAPPRMVGLMSADLIFQIPILKSSRLILRAIRADDHDHLMAMSQDPEIVKHLHEGPAPSAGVVWQRMCMALGQWALRGYGMMAVDDSDGFVGRLGVYHPYDAPDPQIGYILCKRGWRRGYATEGVGLILDWMFRTHRPRRIISEIARENVASARVASKLGATLEKTIQRDEVTFDIWAYPLPKRTEPPANIS